MMSALRSASVALWTAALLAGPAAAKIPGIEGIDHVGLTVPDLGQAIDFFRDVLGCTAVITSGARTIEGDFMQKQLGVPSGTAFGGTAMLRCGHGANIELFDYRSPGRDPRRPNNADLGGHHLGFYTGDLAGAVAELKARGVTVMGEVQHTTAGPSAGQSWVYFLTPWGLQMELVSYPEGKAYEKADPPVRLWSPKSPAD